MGAHLQDFILTKNCHFIPQFENPLLRTHTITCQSQGNKIPSLLESHAKMQLFISLWKLIFSFNIIKIHE
jgi:hypothetical protein